MTGHRCSRLTSKQLLVWLTLLIAILGLVALRYPPSLSSDYSIMTLSWDHYRRTGEFSRTVATDPANIAHAKESLLTWWSPGPQILTGMAEYAGLPIGAGVVVWASLGIILQAWGYHRLLVALGYSDNVVSLTLLATTLSWHSLYALRQFQGGETFASALFPWFCVSLLYCRKSPVRVFCIISCLGLIGSFLKLSFLITTAALTLSVVISAFVDRTGEIQVLKRRARLTLAAFAGLALCWAAVHWGFTSRGINPATGSYKSLTVIGITHATVMAFVLPFCSMFALVSSVGRLCIAAHWPPIEDNTVILAVMIGASAWAYRQSWRESPGGIPKSIVAGFLMTYVAAFALLYAQGASVSFEDRHFRPIALMLLPGLIAVLLGTGRPRDRVTLVSLVALSFLWGIGSYGFRLHGLIRNDSRSARGYSLDSLPVAVEKAIVEINSQLRPRDNNLLCSDDTEAQLAAQNTRVSRIDCFAQEPVIRGRVHSLVLVTSPSEDAETLIKRFVDYDTKGWRRAHIDGWNLLWQSDQPIALSTHS